MSEQPTTPDTARVFTIPASLQAAAEDRVARVNKRLARYGLPLYQVTFVETEPRPVYDDAHCSGVINGIPHYWEQGRMVPCPMIGWEARIKVTITGELPRLADWEPVAVLTRDPDAGVVTRTWPNLTSEPNLSAYRSSEPTCDHCHKARHRKDTYVVRNTTTGELRQIGSSCLHAFTGVKLTIPTWVMDDAFGEMDDWGSRGSGADLRIPVIDVLTVTLQIVAEFGWTSRQAERDSYGQRSATADIVEKVIVTSSGEARKLRNQLAGHYDTAAEKAPLVREYAIHLADRDSGEYAANLAAVARADLVSIRNLPLLASAVASYNRHVERIIRDQAETKAAAASEWLGEVGDKVSVTGTVTTCDVREGDRFTSTLIKVTGDNGNRVTWWASGWHEVEPGTKVTLVGTVKKCDEFRGAKETTLTRCKATVVDTPVAA